MKRIQSIAAVLAGSVVVPVAHAQIHWPTRIGGIAGEGEVSAPSIVSNIFTTFLAVAAIASTAVLIFAGYQYMTARGDAAVLKGVKDKIVWALVGFVIVILAYSIVNVVRGLPFFSEEGTIDEPFLREDVTPPQPTP